MSVTKHPRSLLLLTAVSVLGCSRTPPPAEKAYLPPQPQGVAVSMVRPATALMPVTEQPDLAPTPATEGPAIRPFDQWTEQEAVADTLGRIGPAAVPMLLQAMRHSDAETRLQAVEVLARMGTDAKEAVPDLVRLLDDPDPRIRKAAVRTLGRIGPEAADAVPALMRSLVNPSPTIPGTERNQN